MATHIYALCGRGMLLHLCHKYGARILGICKRCFHSSSSEHAALKHEPEEDEHKYEDYIHLCSICDAIFGVN